MRDEQNALFADIHCADRWCANGGVDYQQLRSETDKTDGEEVSARLFDDIRALTVLPGGTADPECASEAPVLDATQDHLSRCHASATGAEKNVGRDASVSRPDLTLFRMRGAAVPPIPALTMLLGACAPRVLTRSTCIQARAPPRDRIPHLAAAPQAGCLTRSRFSKRRQACEGLLRSADADTVRLQGQAEAGRT